MAMPCRWSLIKRRWGSLLSKTTILQAMFCVGALIDF
jgi:hypothetical protein